MELYIGGTILINLFYIINFSLDLYQITFILIGYLFGHGLIVVERRISRYAI
jgi:hypothetical protein